MSRGDHALRAAMLANEDDGLFVSWIRRELSGKNRMGRDHGNTTDPYSNRNDVAYRHLKASALVNSAHHRGFPILLLAELVQSGLECIGKLLGRTGTPVVEEVNGWLARSHV